jgi:hypothetical protein
MLATEDQTLNQAIANFDGIEVVGVVDYAENLLDKASEVKPEVVLITETLPINRFKKGKYIGAETNLLKICERLVDEGIRVVIIINDRPMGHPFLKGLVGLGVYDIIMGNPIHISQIEKAINEPHSRKDAKMKFVGVEELVEDTPSTDENRMKFLQIVSGLEKERKFNPLFGLFKRKDMKDSQTASPVPEDNSKQEGEDFNTIIPIETENKKPKIKLPEIRLFKNAKEYLKKNKEEISHIQEKSETKSNFDKKFYLRKSGIKPLLIAVMSLHGGAGSTWLLHNFSRYLSVCGIGNTILEALYPADVWYHLLLRESTPSQDWVCWHTSVLEERDIYKDQYWEIGRTLYIPKKDVDGTRFTEDHAEKLIQLSRKNSILFVDLSHEWNDPISKATLKQADEIWMVGQPNPAILDAQAYRRTEIMLLLERFKENFIFIGNLWSNVNYDHFPLRPEIMIPYCKDNVNALLEGKSLYDYNKKSLGVFKHLAKRIEGI